MRDVSANARLPAFTCSRLELCCDESKQEVLLLLRVTAGAKARQEGEAASYLLLPNRFVLYFLEFSVIFSRLFTQVSHYGLRRRLSSENDRNAVYYYRVKGAQIRLRSQFTLHLRYIITFTRPPTRSDYWWRLLVVFLILCGFTDSWIGDRDIPGLLIVRQHVLQ